jgi:chromosome segregation ATPase
MSVQNDSLLNIKQLMEKELDDYFAAINEISDNFDKIKGTEQVISVDSKNELKGDRKTKVINDLSYINEMISNNKQKIADLEQKLRSSNINSNQLRATITRLTNELTGAKERLTVLENELKEKDGMILALNTSVDLLNKKVNVLGENVSVLETENTENQQIILELNSGYYAIGTSKELKNQKILTSGGLFSSAKLFQANFNKDFFTRLDIREAANIKLYTDKAKILTNHPASSYKLETANTTDKKDKNLILKILNPSEFWSLSKFLVIEEK